MSGQNIKRQVHNVLDALQQMYPEAHCALDHKNAFELLVATILSAQCTDVRVNMVTKELFAKYPDCEALGGADPENVEKIIRSTGFFRNKARNIVECSRVLTQEHEGVVPHSREKLVKLPGVGRKTANVVLGNIFNIPAMVVDTHVKRLSKRLGWTSEEDPVKIEKELMDLIPESRWNQTSHLLIFHGRNICKAPTAQCSACPLEPVCPQVGIGRSR